MAPTNRQSLSNNPPKVAPTSLPHTESPENKYPSRDSSSISPTSQDVQRERTVNRSFPLQIVSASIIQHFIIHFDFLLP